ncbi:MAG TPA: cysteine desulfurase [Polyangiaceae bacterium]|nr:cysteine desulfurase [Polyangiaceae bacterium]
MSSLAERLRPEFPLLSRRIDDKPLVYLDAASTTPKPRAVIDAVRDYYESSTANVHRGVHALGERATELYEAARLEVASLIGASPSEVVFVRGTTEAINLVAHGLGLREEDEVVFPASEHHANFLPWRARAKPVLVPVDDQGVPRWDSVEGLLGPRTKLLAFAHASNVTGAIAPVAELAKLARDRGIPVLLDAAQSLSHLPIDVRALGVDFLAASAHKAFGPSGVGVLYARSERLARLRLYQVGGGMVALNRDEGEGDFVPRDAPFRFEAGTPAIEAAIGFGAAVRFLRGIGWDALVAEEHALAERMFGVLGELPGVRLLAPDVPLDRRLAVASFTVDLPGMDAEHVARMLSDHAGICVSGGYHCAHVLHARVGLTGTVRASAHVYNTGAEIDALANALRDVVG